MEENETVEAISGTGLEGAGLGTYLRTANGKVAVEPFPIVGVRKRAVGTGSIKVGGVENTTTLTKLRVVFPAVVGTSSHSASWLIAGSYVYVKTDVGAMPFAKDIYEIDGKKFVLIPGDRVELVVL